MQLRGKARGCWGALVLVALSAALVAPAGAQAGFGLFSFEALTCREDKPTDKCTYGSDDSRFFTEAGAHPGFFVTNFIFNHDDAGVTEGKVHDIRADLPPGLIVNPQSAGSCTREELEQFDFSKAMKACEEAGAEVGSIFIRLSSGRNNSVPIPLPVFNIAPQPGNPAEFGIRLALGEQNEIETIVYLEGMADWAGDFHEGVVIRNLPDFEEILKASPAVVVEARLVFDGAAGRGDLISTGTDCAGSMTTRLTIASFEDPAGRLAYETAPAGLDRVMRPTGCDAVEFQPTIAASLGSASADSPTGLDVDLRVPPNPPTAPTVQSHLKRAVVALPAGIGLNPAAAQNLEACTDQQFGKGVAVGDPFVDPALVVPPPIACPATSAVGTAAIETPLLPDPISGTVYLGQQLSRDPASGDEYRIFVDAGSAERGVFLRLIGRIAADPATGQLTATFDEPEHGGLPQIPFSTFKIGFDQAKGLLTSPPTCGPNTLSTQLFPWTGKAPMTPTAPLPVTSDPRGGACAATLAGRPFAPTVSVRADSPRARSYSPLRIAISRSDGQQELKGLDVTLPPGATAKLAGVPYCSEAALTAAAGRSGAEEQASPSCAAASRVGTASIVAGTGPSPLRIGGRVYLSGPYRGAPISLAVVSPALAGPFDLGTSVVRVALFLDPETARIRATSDPIPDVFGGTKLSVRSVVVDLDRAEFALNGTNCDPGLASTATVLGGGAAPNNPAAFSRATASQPFAFADCAPLAFKPKLDLRVSGATRRNQHAKLAVTLQPGSADANVRSASVALPRALFLDQASLGGVCTRVQYTTGACPPKSVIGTAQIVSPVLSEPLTGPVFLRSSNNALPDMVMHLTGQIGIDVVGRVDNFKGGIRTTFAALPDVPFSKFTLTVPGGKRGLLIASQDLCAKPIRALLRFEGQNGKKTKGKQRLRVACRKRR